MVPQERRGHQSSVHRSPEWPSALWTRTGRIASLMADLPLRVEIAQV